jgi:hypothetical protein
MTSWKRAERRVARALGGERTGPLGYMENDVKGGLGDIFSIEIKYRAKLPQILTAALSQAKAGKTAGSKPPMCVIVQKGQETGEALVCMRLKDFVDLHGPVRV